MTSISVRIEGLDKIVAAFAKAPKVVTEEMDQALKKAILLVRAESTPETPVDKGFLINSNEESFGQLTARLQNNAPYAMFVHDGTKYMSGRPFYKRGLEKSKDSINRAFEDALKKITQRISQ